MGSIDYATSLLARLFDIQRMQDDPDARERVLTALDELQRDLDAEEKRLEATLRGDK